MAEFILICRHNKNGTGYCECLGEYCVEGPCTAEELIEYAPVRHGRWVRKEDDLCYWYECSECGENPAKTNNNDDYFSIYCPHCGAKMDKEEWPCP